jgi:hypothetical protein
MDDETAYLNNYFLARQNAAIGQGRLAAMSQDLSLPGDARADALAAFLQVMDEITDLDAAHNDVMAGFSTPAPPSAQDIARSRQLALAVGVAVARAREADAILAAITTLVDGWRKLA